MLALHFAIPQRHVLVEVHACLHYPRAQSPHQADQCPTIMHDLELGAGIDSQGLQQLCGLVQQLCCLVTA